MDLPFLGVTVRITIVYHILQRVAELGLHANNEDKELERHSKNTRKRVVSRRCGHLHLFCRRIAKSTRTGNNTNLLNL